MNGSYQLVQLLTGQVPLLLAALQRAPLDDRHPQAAQLQRSRQEDAQRAAAHNHVERRCGTQRLPRRRHEDGGWARIGAGLRRTRNWLSWICGAFASFRITKYAGFHPSSPDNGWQAAGASTYAKLRLSVSSACIRNKLLHRMHPHPCVAQLVPQVVGLLQRLEGSAAPRAAGCGHNSNCSNETKV